MVALLGWVLTKNIYTGLVDVNTDLFVEFEVFLVLVQALVNISVGSNRVLNVVKAKYGLKDKSQAIDVVVSEYEENLLEPDFRPEFIDEINRIRKGKFRRVKSLDELLK